MTAVVATFDGSDSAAAVIAIDSLNLAAGDFTFRWTTGSKVYVAKYTP
jgi:hypothetical protein